MTTIHFVDCEGAVTAIDAQNGLSLMENAVAHDILGIVAECGGACACATCCVFVEPEWRDRLTPASEMERDMLDLADGEDTGVRLSCQIAVTSALDGLRVRTPGSD